MWHGLPKVEHMTSNREAGAALSPIEDVIADARAGKLFILYIRFQDRIQAVEPF